MKRLFWILRATIWYWTLTRTPWSYAWGMAESLAETFDIKDYTPEESVREDLTYWGD